MFPEGAVAASQELSGMLEKEWSGVVWEGIGKVRKASEVQATNKGGGHMEGGREVTASVLVGDRTPWREVLLGARGVGKQSTAVTLEMFI